MHKCKYPDGIYECVDNSVEYYSVKVSSDMITVPMLYCNGWTECRSV